MNPKILITAVIMVTALIISAGHLIVSHDDSARSSEQTLELVLRNIGHELLLQAGDSTSRVLPISKMTEGVYQIDFESGLVRFNHDSLYKIVHNNLASQHLSTNYILNVRECETKNIVYGYQVGALHDTLVP